MPIVTDNKNLTASSSQMTRYCISWL